MLPEGFIAPSVGQGRETVRGEKVKRRFVKLGLLLLLGAIVNVAVAWGCTYNNGPVPLMIVRDPTVMREVTDSDQSLLARFWPAEYPKHFIFLEVRNAFGVRLTTLYTGAGLGWFSAGFECGWPFLALQQLDWSSTNSSSPTGKKWILHLGERIVPIGMLWPGFAINTVFYAAILWLLFAAPGRIRRFIRIKRGRCGACGYPVGASPVCTECGKPITPLPKTT
jgi:hypothetical protein